MKSRGILEFPLLFLDPITTGTALRDTLLADKTLSQDEAIIEIYRRLRPGDPPTLDTATNLFNNLFFNAERYDLSKVGRLKLNHKLEFDGDEQVEYFPTGVNNAGGERSHSVIFRRCAATTSCLRSSTLVDLKNGTDAHQEVSMTSTISEIVAFASSASCSRISTESDWFEWSERSRSACRLQEIETLMPHDLINSKPVSAVIKEFFGSSQLSQFMDQTNPLSSVTHKRRLSALGPGGLTRERAGFEVRDVHPTHYGRICPIETPEGPNIGLIASLSTFARVNDMGFIETPLSTGP